MIRALVVIVVILVAALGWSLWRAEAATAAAQAAGRDARAAADSAEAIGFVLARERESAEDMAQVGLDYEEMRRDAEDVPAAVVDGIDDGSIRLRKQWAACETSRLAEVGAATAERDALAQLRKQDQGNLVRIGRDADDHIRACQAIIRADRGRGGE